MKANIKKIAAFYKTDTGQYVKNAIISVLSHSIKDHKGVCVIAPSAQFYQDFLQKHFDFISYHTPENQPDDVYSLSWPTTSQSINTVLMIHDIEFSKNPDNHLAEAKRVLKGDGQLYVIFPNRSGKWARQDNTPFGVGTPSTVRQMTKMITEKGFVIKNMDGALYYPPYPPRIQSIRNLFEVTAGLCGLYPPGVVIIEAYKQDPAIASPSLVDKASETVREVLSPKPQPSGNSSRLK